MAVISIHAPRTGSDNRGYRVIGGMGDFNPRSPHGERPAMLGNMCRESTLFQSTLPARGATYPKVFHTLTALFQSTLPARGATVSPESRCTERADFNPRSPHGERPAFHQRQHAGGTISIHAPRTGSDLRWQCGAFSITGFQSTLPARGATVEVLCRSRRFQHFNPRSPHGERRKRMRLPASTAVNFNPRSPHGERRYNALHTDSAEYNFNPRSPHGERRTTRQS